MKACLITIVVILAIIVLLFTAALVYLFAFEKELPQSTIDTLKEYFAGISEASAPYSIYTLNSFGDVESTLTLIVNDYVLLEDTYNRYYINKKGKDENLVLIYKEYATKDYAQIVDAKFYIEDGKYLCKNGENITEYDKDDWETSVLFAFLRATPFYKDGDNVKLKGAETIEKHLSKIKQKGFVIKAYAEGENTSFAMTYNIRTSMISNYDIETRTQAGDVITSKTIENYSISFDISNYINMAAAQENADA